MLGVRGRLAAISTAAALLLGALALPPGSVAAASAGAGQDGAVHPATFLQPPQTGRQLPLDSLATGTAVSSQFERDGIVFSGQSPYISTDPAYFFDTRAVLAGGVQHEGTIVGTFV